MTYSSARCPAADLGQLSFHDLFHGQRKKWTPPRHFREWPEAPRTARPPESFFGNQLVCRLASRVFNLERSSAQRLAQGPLEGLVQSPAASRRLSRSRACGATTRRGHNQTPTEKKGRRKKQEQGRAQSRNRTSGKKKEAAPPPTAGVERKFQTRPTKRQGGGGRTVSPQRIRPRSGQHDCTRAARDCSSITPRTSQPASRKNADRFRVPRHHSRAVAPPAGLHTRTRRPTGSRFSRTAFISPMWGQAGFSPPPSCSRRFANLLAGKKSPALRPHVHGTAAKHQAIRNGCQGQNKTAI